MLPAFLKQSLCSSIFAIHGYDHSAAEADILLECDPGTFHLADTGLTTKLPNKFGALGKARCSQRMALGKQTS
jgi:dUTPase